jgi:hypothetical protein
MLPLLVAFLHGVYASCEVTRVARGKLGWLESVCHQNERQSDTVGIDRYAVSEGGAVAAKPSSTKWRTASEIDGVGVWLRLHSSMASRSC